MPFIRYLEACIKEALRLRAPVREFFRNLPKGGMFLIDEINYHITPEAQIIIVPDYVHHEEKHFENPFEYR